MNTLVVAGTFDMGDGKRSGLIDKLFASYPEPVTMYNGGSYSSLQDILNSAASFDVVYWFANVDNSLPKVRNVKDINPKCMLVTSKRNDDEKYCFEELINHALGIKANLVFEFSKIEDIFNIRVYDPLGSVWCDKTSDFEAAAQKAYARLSQLIHFTRQGTIMENDTIDFQVEDGFLSIIHEKAEVFHKLIQPPEVVNRFLGNVSFRCTNGFPSFRGDNCIVVSRRNVDKNGISNKDFVPVKLIDGKVHAYGEFKPSVDTPVQVRLYDLLPDINYMLHSHVYIKDAPFTAEAIPCGAIEEVESIARAIALHGIDTSKSFSLNLLGHGNIVFATSLDFFDSVEYVNRSMPEILG